MTAPLQRSSGSPPRQWPSVARAALGPVLVVAVLTAVQLVARPYVPTAVGATLALLAVLATYYAHAHFIERREPLELAPSRLPEAVWGALLGVALLAATLLGLAALGAYHVQGRSAFSIDVPAAIAVGLLGATVEELLFRGYVFRWIAAANPWWAILASAALFGGLHGFNPGATAFSSVAIALEAGVLLSVAYLASGNLWFPIGIHFGWNFAEGPIFNVPISGNPTPGLVLGSLNGPAWLTGGNFGVEASVVAIAVCLSAGVALSFRAVVLGRLRWPPADARAA
jgi:membrane protease YdiL (CAAX protease family)